MLFCGQDDVSKTYPSIEMATFFCEFWKFKKLSERLKFWKFGKLQRTSLCVRIWVRTVYGGSGLGWPQKEICCLFSCEVIGIFKTCTYNHFYWVFFLFFKDYSESNHSETYVASPEEFFHFSLSCFCPKSRKKTTLPSYLWQETLNSRMFSYPVHSSAVCSWLLIKNNAFGW